MSVKDKVVDFFKGPRKYLGYYFIMLLTLLFWHILASTTEAVSFYLLLILIVSIVIQLILSYKSFYWLFLFRFLFSFLFLLEIGLGFLAQSKTNTENTIEELSSKSYHLKESVLGWQFKPSTNKAFSTKLIKTDTIYSVSYSSDEYGRRIADEDVAIDTTAQNHAVFVGCSFTFGEGISFQATFPYQFENAMPSYKSYNYGFRGYGPHQIALFFNPELDIINPKSLSNKQGFMMYTYIEDHLNRVYGSSSYLSYGSKSPDVFVVDHELVFRPRSKTHLFLAELINDSYLLKYFNLRLYHPKFEFFYKRFAALINYTAQQYWHRFPNNNFYVSIYPGHNYEMNWLAFLDKRIKIIEIPMPEDYNENKAQYHINLKYDLHPALKFNAYYAKELAKIISAEENR